MIFINYISLYIMQTMGNYQIIKELGKGNQATIYLVRDLKYNELYALK